MSLDTIHLWFKRVHPDLSQRELDLQMAIVLEEFQELMFTFELEFNKEFHLDQRTLANQIAKISWALKEGQTSLTVKNREKLAKEGGDLIVATMGLLTQADMNAKKIVQKIDESNWSKLDYNGMPTYDSNGKVIKGENYRAPNLSKYI